MWWVRCSLTAVASCSLLAHPILAQQRSSQTTTQVHYVDADDAGVSVDKHTSAVDLSRPPPRTRRASHLQLRITHPPRNQVTIAQQLAPLDWAFSISFAARRKISGS